MAYPTPRNSVGGPSLPQASNTVPPPAITLTGSGKSSSSMSPQARKGSISRTSSMLKKRLSLSTFLKKRRQTSGQTSVPEEYQYPPLEPLQEGTLMEPTLEQNVTPQNTFLHNGELHQQSLPKGWQYTTATTTTSTAGHSRKPSSMSLPETKSPALQQDQAEQRISEDHHHPIHPHAMLPSTPATPDQDYHLATKPLPRRPHPMLHTPLPPPSPPLLPTRMVHDEQHQQHRHHEQQPHQRENTESTTSLPVSYFPTPAQSSSSQASSPSLHPTNNNNATSSPSCSPQAAVVSASSSLSTAGSLTQVAGESSNCSVASTTNNSTAASMSSLMLPPSDLGVSDMTIPEEEEEEFVDEEHDGLSSYGTQSTHADDDDDMMNSENTKTLPGATHMSSNVDDDVHRSKSKIKRGAHKIKKWLRTGKAKIAGQETATLPTTTTTTTTSSAIKRVSASSSSSLLAVVDEKAPHFQHQRLRRPSSQRDQDASPPLESNVRSSKELRHHRDSKALVVRPKVEHIVVNNNVPFPVILPEYQPRHTRSASMQVKNAVALYTGPRRHSSQVLSSSMSTMSSSSSRRSIDSTDELRRSLQRIAHFNQRFRQLLPGPNQPCPPIRARSSSLPRSFSPALAPLARLPVGDDAAVAALVAATIAGGDAIEESRQQHSPAVQSPLAITEQFEHEYQQHLEEQAELEQAEQEKRQKRQSVWVDYVDLELPESLPSSLGATTTAARAAAASRPTTTPPSTPKRGPMYWSADAATSLQSIPSMPSSSPANSRRNSLAVSVLDLDTSSYDDDDEDDDGELEYDDDDCLLSSGDPDNTLADEHEEYQVVDEEEVDDYNAEKKARPEYRRRTAPYPSFMTKWDMEIASESDRPLFPSHSEHDGDDWIHHHADHHSSLPSTRRSSTVAESASTMDPLSLSSTSRLTGFIQYKTMMPNNSNAAIGKRFFWAMEAPSLPKPESNSNPSDA